LFRKDFKKEDTRHYILYLPDDNALNLLTRSTFVTIHDTHWGIESFHRAIKQVCGICRFMVSQRVAEPVLKTGFPSQASGVGVPAVVATGEPVRVRDSHAIKTHIFCSLQAFVRLELMRSENLISLLV
jgi:hypothetical protein